MNTFYFKYSEISDFDEIADYALGIRSNIKNKSELHHYLLKAKAYNFKYFKIPFNLDNLNDANQLNDEINENGLRLVALLDLKKHLFSVLEVLSPLIPIEFIIDSNLDLEIAHLLENELLKLRENKHFFKITLVCHKLLNIEELLTSLKTFQHDITLYFSPNYHDNALLLSPSQAKEVISKYSTNLPHSPWQILWDNRIPDDLELTPYYLPVYSNCHCSTPPDCSIIIPLYNNKDYILRCLKNLLHLEYSREKFEVIIVDDGSNDGSYESTLLFLKNECKSINFKYLYLPRFQRRTMGDSRYRAGIARNLGIINSNGTTLFFLDSDIIVYPEYLTENLKFLEKHDLVQSVRYNLSEDSSAKKILYPDFDENDFVDDDSYWSEFHKKSEWNDLSNKWKFLCTHSLTLKRDLLYSTSSFGINYIFYGFEDTDLGYKLNKKELSFKLSKKPLYHLHHSKSRSEFFKSSYLRKLLLARTAQIFFFINQDLLIYNTFKDLMILDFSPMVWLKNLALRIKKGIIGKWPILK